MRNIYQVSITCALVIAFSIIPVFGQTLPVSIPASTNTASNYSLAIENEDGKQTKLTLTDIEKLKRQTVKGNDHGTEITFEGYPLIEVLKLAGIELGDSLRGKRFATFLLVEAADNYQAVFALPELDPAFTDRVIILADRRDGQPLSEKEGVLRVIVPDEKKPGRWVRQVIGLKILRAGSPSK